MNFKSFDLKLRMNLKMRSLLQTWMILSVCKNFAMSYEILEMLFEGLGGGVLLQTMLGPIRDHCMNENQISYRLYTRKDPRGAGQELQPDDLLSRPSLCSKCRTKFIIHGFLDTLKWTRWMQEMKDALLKEGDYNVIIVDWSCGNNFPYKNAMKNAQITAVNITNMIEFLQMEPHNIHIIGHSLGAHIAALCGQGVRHLARISGLDPAGPGFYDAPPEQRLDSQDATFVDVIHTNDGESVLEGMGYYPPAGHLDFYPNGGRHQPGCDKMSADSVDRNDFTGFASFFICDHLRSAYLYTDSIDLRNSCPAILCKDYDLFQKGLCSVKRYKTGSFATMGFHSDEFFTAGMAGDSKRYFCNTAARKPFCSTGNSKHLKKTVQ